MATGPDQNDRGPRKFSDTIEKGCWEKSPLVPGRDPQRWRYDAAGNPVLKDLRGWHGLAGWEFDNARPYSAGGLSTQENCQVLQTKANRRKGKEENVTWRGLQEFSCDIKLNDQHMDAIELGMYGNIKGPKGEIKCEAISRAQATGMRLGNPQMNKLKPCPDPFTCPKESECCADLQLLTKLLVGLRCKSYRCLPSSTFPGASATLPGNKPASNLPAKPR